MTGVQTCALPICSHIAYYGHGSLFCGDTLFGGGCGRLFEGTPQQMLAVVAGTLSGAPKPRAMEIIETLEPTRRGVYGGVIGYLDFRGNIDTCIAIRTSVIKDGKAYVQAGAGVVADSDPISENQECINKAAAVLAAVAAANGIKNV